MKFKHSFLINSGGIDSICLMMFLKDTYGLDQNGIIAHSFDFPSKLTYRRQGEGAELYKPGLARRIAEDGC